MTNKTKASIEEAAKLPTAEETLYTYHPIGRDHELSTDLWPDDTVLMAMNEHTAAHTAALREELNTSRQATDNVLEQLVSCIDENKLLKERIKELEDKITKLQEKYDENGCDLNPVIKLQRIESHIDASFEILNKRLSVLENMLSLSESSKSKISEDNESKNIRISQLESLMQEFVDRVDQGEVRSKRTYTKFKEALK